KCACCRRIWQLLTDKRSRAGVVLAERFAGGEVVDEKKLRRAVERARAASEKLWESRDPHDPRYPLYQAAETAKDTTANKGLIALGLACWTATVGADASAKVPPSSKRGKAAFEAAHRQAFIILCDYIRDVFGNPFRPVVLDPVWRTPTVTALATAAYEDRHFP